MYVHGKQDRTCDPWALTFKALVLPLKSRRKQAKLSRSQTREVRDCLHRGQAFCLVTCWPTAWTLGLVFISHGNKTLNFVTRGGMSSGTALSTSSVHSFLFSMIWGEPEVPWSEIAQPSCLLLDFTITGIYSHTTDSSRWHIARPEQRLWKHRYLQIER